MGENEVLSIGTGVISGENLAQAREQAISQALVKGTETYIVRRLGSRGVVSHFQQLVQEIIPHSREYIANFLILTEHREESRYKVLVKLRINKEVLDDKLRAAGMLLPDIPPIKVLFLVSEKKDDSTFCWWKDPGLQPSMTEAELALYNAFQARGFNPINRTLSLPETEYPENLRSPELPEEDIVAWGRLFSAEVVIYGRAEVTDQDAAMDLRAIDVNRGVEICAGKERVSLEGELLKERPLIEAMEGLSGRIAVRFAPAMIQAAVSEQEKVVRLLVTVKDLHNYREFTIFRDFLRNEVTGVLSVIQKRIRLDSISIEVKFRGNAFRFLNRVLNHENLPFPMSAEQTEKGEIILSAS